MTVSMGMNNEILIRDYFKLRIQVLQQVMKVIYVIDAQGWSVASAKKADILRQFPYISEDKHHVF